MSEHPLPTADYTAQTHSWPASGRHILAHCDDHSIIVYQAYRPEIGLYALAHGHFGGPDFSLSRMSWIKPNFLWMMYRSGWGAKPGQEVVLGLRLRRTFFDSLLEQAVASSFDPTRHPTHAAWQAALAESSVRLQWDPDHAPDGGKLTRKAVQLGLRGAVLAEYAQPALLEVIDCTALVAEQRQNLERGATLLTPIERVYPIANPIARQNLQVDDWPGAAD